MLAQFNQAATGLGSTAQVMAQALTAFAGPAQALTKALEAMPREMTMTGNHTVNVNHNGAEMFSKLTPEIKSWVADSVKAEFGKVFRRFLHQSPAVYRQAVG